MRVTARDLLDVSVPNGAVTEAGVRANVSSYTRHHPNVAMTKAKISGNYANSVLAKQAPVSPKTLWGELASLRRTA